MNALEKLCKKFAKQKKIVCIIVQKWYHLIFFFIWTYLSLFSELTKRRKKKMQQVSRDKWWMKFTLLSSLNSRFLRPTFVWGTLWPCVRSWFLIKQILSGEFFFDKEITSSHKSLKFIKLQMTWGNQFTISRLPVKPILQESILKNQLTKFGSSFQNLEILTEQNLKSFVSFC